MTDKKQYHWDSGKGSRPRPYEVTQEEYCNNWDAIFGKKDKPKEENLVVSQAILVASAVVEVTKADEG